MVSLHECPLTTEAIRKLEHRRSYMAKAPFQQHKSKKKYLGDVAMKFCPATWLGPAIIRLNDKYEYKKDRKHVQEVYVEYQEHMSRKNSLIGADGRGSIVDLHTYLAPVEWTPLEDSRQDPWRNAKEKTEDPWRLPPVNEIV